MRIKALETKYCLYYAESSDILRQFQGQLNAAI